ncbi:hypothetical protein M2277_002076 [Paenibacillus sp. LBL]|nr:hypothetical protein [Paenibacillus sp. LBL]
MRYRPLGKRDLKSSFKNGDGKQTEHAVIFEKGFLVRRRWRASCPAVRLSDSRTKRRCAGTSGLSDDDRLRACSQSSLACWNARRGTAFVSQLPHFGLSVRLGKKPQMIRLESVVRSPVLCVGTRLLTRVFSATNKRATPFLAILGMVVAVRFHIFANRANRYACWRDPDLGVGGSILFRSDIEVDKRLDVLSVEPFVDSFGVMSGIEQHLIDCAQGETLRKFHGTEDQTYSVVPGSWL